MPPRKATELLACELRVLPQWILPEIWRRLRVPHDIRLDQLHQVLQVGVWLDRITSASVHRLGTAEKARRYIGDVQGAECGFADDPPPMDDEQKSTLDQFLHKRGDRLDYEYNFGDGWHHDIVLAALTPQTARVTTALCLHGARACPPEDWGGPPGYENSVAAVQDPNHPEHDEMLDWIGDEFDPEAFDLAITNRALARLKL